MEAPHPVVFRRLAVGLHPDMPADGAEIFGESGVVVEADLLVAEEQHQVFGKGAAELGELLPFQRPGEIDIADLGADMGAVGDDLDGPVGRGVPAASMAVHFRFPPGWGEHPAYTNRSSHATMCGLFRRGAWL